MTILQLKNSVSDGELDDALFPLYAPDRTHKSLDMARNRVIHVIEQFIKHFGDERREAALFSSPGRTEIGGNHTDHQHGHVLCGSVDLDLLACAALNGTDTVRVLSEGYRPFEVDLRELTPKKEEKGTTTALVRGVADMLMQEGYHLGGFDVYMQSVVPAGAGLSSSAAFEILTGVIFNHFFCRQEVDAVMLARAGQYAENVYFGKPCGMMDQMGSAVGGITALDFLDPAAPVSRKTGYDFSESGHVLCITETGGSHADLTADYVAIPKEMCRAAACFGKSVLREVPEEKFFKNLSIVRKSCGDRAVLRAMHYYEDDRYAQEEAAALEAKDFGCFLKLVNASGMSSAVNLQNLYSPGDPSAQSVSLALALGRRLLEGTGAIRVHGGGFAGTVQAFVPEEKLESFRAGMEQVFGTGSCHVVHIRQVGGCVITQ